MRRIRRWCSLLNSGTPASLAAPPKRRLPKVCLSTRPTRPQDSQCCCHGSRMWTTPPTVDSFLCPHQGTWECWLLLRSLRIALTPHQRLIYSHQWRTWVPAAPPSRPDHRGRCPVQMSRKTPFTTSHVHIWFSWVSKLISWTVVKKKKPGVQKILNVRHFNRWRHLEKF